MRFHASKTVAMKYLQQWKCNIWTAKQFEEVNWEHLDLAHKNKADNWTTIKYGDLNKPPDSAVQYSRSAITQVTHTLMEDSQTADQKKWMPT
jgi:hypothetical protein